MAALPSSTPTSDTLTSRFELADRDHRRELNDAMSGLTDCCHPILIASEGALTGVISGLALNILGDVSVNMLETIFLGSVTGFSATLALFAIRCISTDPVSSSLNFDKIASVALGVVSGVALTTLAFSTLSVPAIIVTSVMTGGLLLSESLC
ncbi:MAG: hypothetical protein SP1CHLAM54_07860 [Chlamydiia bacterium]|nr:hypothetical protein [Chlamydiia bacterium]MCH9615692.1 hypothetical protein [Chlamydiia bacterium]MCH9628905.1 hypothetical protein [Chlamydiia bacterium]